MYTCIYMSLVYRLFNIKSHENEYLMQNLKMNTQKEYLLFQLIKQMTTIFYFVTSLFLVSKSYDDYKLFVINATEEDYNNEKEEYRIFGKDSKRYDIINQMIATNRFFADEKHDYLSFLDKKQSQINKLNYDQFFPSFVSDDVRFKKCFEIFNQYDDGFNLKIAFEKLTSQNLNKNDVYKIIFYYVNNLRSSRNYLRYFDDPIEYSREITIFRAAATDRARQRIVPLRPLRTFNGNKYTVFFRDEGVDIYHVLDKNFKDDILNGSFMDGYEYPITKETFMNVYSEYEFAYSFDDYKRSIEECNIFLADVSKDNMQLAAVYVFKNFNPDDTTQEHWYVRRKMEYDILCLIKNITPEKNLALKLHTFACEMFNCSAIENTLMESMRDIFRKSDIKISGTSKMSLCSGRGEMHDSE